jgi:glycosyltransferase involved in cell wall biosynthesis
MGLKTGHGQPPGMRWETSDRRLLFVVNETAFFVSHRLPIGIAARTAGYDVHLAALDSGQVELIRSHGITYHPVRLNSVGINPLRDTELVLQLWDLVRRLRPALLHTVTIKPVLYGGIVARVLGVPALVSAVSGLGFIFGYRAKSTWPVRRIVEQLYRLALAHRNSRTIFQNRDDRAQFLAAGLVASDRAVLIRGSGVDMGLFRPSEEPSEPPVVVLPARLVWEKGVGEFVEAARHIHAAGKAARFVLVGDLTIRNRARVPRERLEAWMAEGVVEWWGYRADMPAVYAESHIVCLPTFYREGVPKVLIEAAACGRPIVATDTPGCREIVRHGENGLLVPPRSAAALAEALLPLLGDSPRRVAMGQRGRAIAVAGFSTEHVVEATLAVYQELLGAGPVPAPRS